MFKIIFQLIILIYIILSVYHVIDLQKYNINGIIMDTYDLEEVKIHNSKLNPSILHNITSFNVNDPSINYIQDINNYKKLIRKKRVFNMLA